MNKKVYKISLLFFSTIAILLVADKLIKYFNETEIFHYDINGNEIYHKTGNYIKYTEYNEDNQPLEIKEKYNKNKYDYTYYEYDGGLLKKKIQRRDPSAQKPDFEILYEYDERGNKIKEIIPSLNETTSYEYDDYSRLIKEFSPDGRIYEYKYDEKGNLIETKCSADSSCTQEWDDKGRIIKRTYVNDRFWRDNIYTWKYTDDDPKIKYICYVENDSIMGDLSYFKYDKHDECIESGEIVNGKEKAIKRNYIKYEFWDNGKIKTKKIYKDNNRS
jgi:YD repeat-containing protein